eukprot:gene23424-29642_t
MNLVAINFESVPLGEPLPFALRAASGALLAQKGFVVRNASELSEITGRGIQLCVDVDESGESYRAYVGRLQQMLMSETSLGELAAVKMSAPAAAPPPARNREERGPLDWSELQLRTTQVLPARVIKIIHDKKLDIKVQLGVWIQNGQDDLNKAEIVRGVKLANTYKDIVLAVSVGNETMVSWAFNPVTPALMGGYIKSVRDQITQPVTTNDNWAFFAKNTGEPNNPKSIVLAIDYVSMHTYPLADSIHSATKWNWKQAEVAANLRATAMMDAAIEAAKSDFSAVRSYLDGIGMTSLPIVIGETGWKSVASNNETSRAHPVNQKMFYERLNAWMSSATTSKPAVIFYFEAFDEPWKGSDDKWGLFNVERKAKYVIQDLYPSAIWETGTYAAADALYYIPTATNSTITASRYTVYSDVAVPGEAKTAVDPLWVGWESTPTAFSGSGPSGSAPEGSNIREITPAPKEWGWGMIAALVGSSDDLSSFAATGKLNFSIMTTYPGSIEVGFLTGTADESSAYDVYKVLTPGSYGYNNNGAWHQVSIPISDIIPSGGIGYEMDPTKSKLDLSKVTNPFVIADRYAKTGKPANTNSTVKIYIDNVYWSK